MIIYCHTPLDEPLRDKLRTELSGNHTLHFLSEAGSEEDVKKVFQDAQFILGNPPVDWFKQPLPNLKFWQLDSAGFDQYSGISLGSDTRIANMGDWFARPCAETIVGGVMALYRGLDTLTLLKQKSEWIGTKLRPQLRLLYHQNTVILGAGTIGLAVKEILAGLGCHIHIMARTSPAADLRSKEELLHELQFVDLVINTLPGTATHFADQEFFAAMKEGSVYASVGRGSTTDENALIEALRSKRLDGAVLDVTAVEPLPADSPLWSMENVILTQHTAGGHNNEHMGKVDLFLNNIINIENGGNLVNEINLSKGY